MDSIEYSLSSFQICLEKRLNVSTLKLFSVTFFFKRTPNITFHITKELTTPGSADKSIDVYRNVLSSELPQILTVEYPKIDYDDVRLIKVYINNILRAVHGLDERRREFCLT